MKTLYKTAFFASILTCILLVILWFCGFSGWLLSAAYFVSTLIVLVSVVKIVSPIFGEEYLNMYVPFLLSSDLTQFGLMLEPFNLSTYLLSISVYSLFYYYILYKK